MMCGLEKLGLVDQNGFERELPALLLRALAAGRRPRINSSFLGLVSIWSKEA